MLPIKGCYHAGLAITITMNPLETHTESSLLHASPRLIIPELPSSIQHDPSSTGTSPTSRNLHGSWTSDHDPGFLTSNASMFHQSSRHSKRKNNREANSPSRDSSADRGSDTPSWMDKFSPRPWKMTPRKKEPIPREQTEAYLRTRAVRLIYCPLVYAVTYTCPFYSE